MALSRLSDVTRSVSSEFSFNNLSSRLGDDGIYDEKSIFILQEVSKFTFLFYQLYMHLSEEGVKDKHKTLKTYGFAVLAVLSAYIIC